jgi:hypothetical protein
MAFDPLTFAEKGTLGYLPVQSSVIAPSTAFVHTVVVFFCGEGSNVINVDKCTAVFCSPCGRKEEDVVVEPYHILGNMFAVAIPPLGFLVGTMTVQVDIMCGSERIATANVSIGVTPRVLVPVKSYTAFRLPLHFASLSGDVVSALRFLERGNLFAVFLFVVSFIICSVCRKILFRRLDSVMSLELSQHRSLCFTDIVLCILFLCGKH